MKKRDHASALSARRELTKAGFVTAFSSPGRPECWGKPGDRKTRYAIAREDRERCQKWHIVDYPGSPVCSPGELDLTVPVIPRNVNIEAEFAYLE